MNARKFEPLYGLIRYEILRSWRRGALRMILFLTLTLPQLLFLLDSFFNQAFEQELSVRLTLWPEAARMMATAEAINASFILLILVLIFLPIMFAELIPLDRQYLVREVIDTLPISTNQYLAGKTMSAWIISLIAVGLSALVSSGLSWLIKGPFSAATVGAYWLTGPIPLALFASQMSVMLAANQSSRRKAITKGMIASGMSAAAWLILPGIRFNLAALLRSGATPEQLSSPAYLAKLPAYPALFSVETWLPLGGVAAVMVLVWISTTRQIKRKYYED